MSKILAIDPGPKQSGVAALTDRCCVLHTGTRDNAELLRHIHASLDTPDVIAIETVQAMGMPVGEEVFTTCIWVGRFIEAHRLRKNRLLISQEVLIRRTTVKLTLCGTARAKDKNIRQAIIDRYGGSRKAAIGTKKNPGPLYGVSGHAWSALAVGLTYLDTQKENNQNGKAQGH